MEEITIKTYSVQELSEEAKEKAIDELWSINVDYDWWNYIYFDAEDIGCKITSFDMDRGEIGFEFTSEAEKVAQNILKTLIPDRDKYKTAQLFLESQNRTLDKYCNNAGEFQEDQEYEFEQEIKDIEEDFRQALGEDFLSSLRKEYEWLVSEESIIETIKANDYNFTESGELY